MVVIGLTMGSAVDWQSAESIVVHKAIHCPVVTHVLHYCCASCRRRQIASCTAHIYVRVPSATTAGRQTPSPRNLLVAALAR